MEVKRELERNKILAQARSVEKNKISENNNKNRR